MIIRKTLKQKEYLLLLKKDISDFVKNFSKRYKLFPWNNLKKVTKIKTDNQAIITVQDVEYSINELVKTISNTKTLIQIRLKTSHYNPVLKAYIKDSIHAVNEEEIKDIYIQYKNELKRQFDETRDKLLFCLDGLRELNKYFKKSHSVTESNASFDLFTISNNNNTEHSFNIFFQESEEFNMAKIYDYERYLDNLENIIMQENSDTDYYEAELNNIVSEISDNDDDPDVSALQESQEFDEFKKFKYVNSEGGLSDIRDDKIEIMEAMLYEDESEFDIYSEGTNIETSKVYHTYKKQIKALIKEYKRYKKANDFANARKTLDKIEQNINAAEAEIESLDDERFGTMLKGWILTYILTMFRAIYLIIPVVGPFIVTFKSIKDLINEVITIIDDIKHDKLSPQSFNSHRTRLKSYFKEARSLVNALRNNLKETEKKEKQNNKKDAAVKEAARYMEEKRSIYEACSKGEISLEEREDLIYSLNNKKYISEASDYDIANNFIDKAERFSKIKRVLYERCEQGEISILDRESLIAKAREMIFETVKDIPDDTSKTKPDPKNDPEKMVKEIEQNMDKTMSKFTK